MARARLVEADRVREVPVPKSCLAGRHWSCHLRFSQRTVPQFWVELRWFEQGWAWRALNLIDETRGAGANLGNGWRRLSKTGGRAPKIVISADTWFEFIDLSPPSAFAHNVETNAFVEGEALDDLWECLDGAFYRFGWEDAEGASARLRDGDLVSSQSELYRVFVSEQTSAPTLMPQLRLLVADCTVTIDVDKLTATFESDVATVRAVGECVRVLAAYGLARRDEHFEDGGWLTAPESYRRWLALGGNPSSNADRIGFERGKLRNQLRKAGVLDVKALFERQTSGYRTTLRLSLTPTQIFVVGEHGDGG